MNTTDILLYQTKFSRFVEFRFTVLNILFIFILSYWVAISIDCVSSERLRLGTFSSTTCVAFFCKNWFTLQPTSYQTITANFLMKKLEQTRRTLVFTPRQLHGGNKQNFLLHSILFILIPHATCYWYSTIDTFLHFFLPIIVETRKDPNLFLILEHST